MIIFDLGAALQNESPLAWSRPTTARAVQAGHVPCSAALLRSEHAEFFLRKSRAHPAARFSSANIAQRSKVRGDQFVGPLAAPGEYFGGGLADQIPIGVESVEKARFILPQI